MSEQSFANKRILVVDDEERIVRFIRLNLEQDGFRVEEAFSGKGALDKLRQTLPDLILLDVMLPDIEGFDVLAMIRENHDVPIIMLTAKTEEDDRVRGLRGSIGHYRVSSWRSSSVPPRDRQRHPFVGGARPWYSAGHL